MDENQFLQYLKDKGMAQVGKEDTLKSAQALEARGMVARLKEPHPVTGNPIYVLSLKGVESLSTGQKKSLLRNAIGALQDYATAMREDGSGGSDLARMGGVKVGQDPDFDYTRKDKRPPQD